MKTLGCKVPDEVFERVSSLGAKSDILRCAIQHYITYHTDIQVNLVNPDAETSCDVEEYQRLVWELEAVLNRFKQHIEKSKRRRMNEK